MYIIIDWWIYSCLLPSFDLFNFILISNLQNSNEPKCEKCTLHTVTMFRKQVKISYYPLLEEGRSVSIYELWHKISNNTVCATSKSSDQPAHTPSLIRAFASRLNIL